MSRPAEWRGSAPDGSDGGFTLVEVIVAIGIVMTLLVAVLPQLIGGIKATDLARSSSQAKGLATSELERMRNLPFQVEPNAGNFVDLFDRYFHDLTPAVAPQCTAGDQHVPPGLASTGYVDADAGRCDWEPDGAFYRVVRTTTGPHPDPDLEGFVVVTATQFLDAQTPPGWKEPRPGYDTETTGSDVPASSQVGVTVTVLRDRPSDRSPVTTYTQIARSYQTRTQVRATADATALEVGVKLPGPTDTDGNAVSATGALLHLDASLVASSRVDLAGAGLTASAGTGENAGTTRATGTAPPDTALTWSSSTSNDLIGTDCVVVCWGGGETSGTWTPATADGLPGIGTPTAPVGVALKTPSAGAGFALRVGMGDSPDYLPGLGVTNPLVRMRDGDVTSGMTGCQPSLDNGSLRLHSAGWAHTTDHRTGGGADACAATHSAEVSVLPLANGGPRVTVQLRSAYARCQVTGPGHVANPPSYGFTADVKVYGPASTTTPVLSRTLTSSTSSDTLPDPATVMVGDRPLSTWIDSWSAASPGAGITTVVGDGVVRVDIPSVVSILTQPLRQRRDATGTLVVQDDAPVPDPQSALSVTVGSVSCSAEDHR
ncbi:hypothetical protein BKA08_001906 [Nocardioides marinisabuli]|uniref:Prepilin-type N-terminal cleavage/methylation domain-containing protein n=1 Tax=Nocardioides marinisabuli TaxID=419476 RepID=A0A7Y9JRL1_9ACTN|nr:type II secretion system protein [Nocardioides marinisabuli]NYD57668.1 hypothetical protein [Nocardioides marinisabuli]